MDEQPITQPSIQPTQTPQTSVSPNFFSKNKRILIIISTLIIFIILAGIIFITKPFNLFQNTLTNDQNRNVPGGLRSYKTTNSFSGEVVEKGTDYLIIRYKEQTIKAILDPNINIRIIEKAEFLKNPDVYIAQPGKFINIADINTGDLVDTTGQFEGTALKVSSAIITK